MKKSIRTGVLVVSYILTPANAAVIIASGADTDTTNGAWRTSSVSKPLDADGNNIYGSDGYLMFNTGYIGGSFTSSTNIFANASNALPTYVSVTADGATGSVGAAAFASIDDPLNAPTDFQSGVATISGVGLGAEVSMLNLTFNGTVPIAGIRVGVLVNNAANRNASAIRFELDGNAAVTASQNTGTGVNQQQDYYFFDITGISNGDVFSFFATEDTGDGNNAGEVRVGGFTFDTIPEPGSMTLLGLALGFLAVRRRRQP